MSPHLNFLQGLVALNPNLLVWMAVKEACELMSDSLQCRSRSAVAPLERLKILLQVPISLYDLSGTLISSN
jgi:hypothetical protein